MAPSIWWLSIALYARLGLAVAGGSSSTDEVTCTDTTVSTNLFANPSWEDGTSSWTYSFAAQTTDAYADDGSYSLVLPGQYSYWYIYQTVSDLVSGGSYQVSIDVMPYLNPAYGVQETCNLYLFHTSLTTANLIAYKTGQAYTKNTNQWITLSGDYTATGSSDLFGIYMTCSPYHVNTIFNVYVDNAQLITTTTTEVCTTVTPTPTPTPTPSSVVSSVASSSVMIRSSSAALTPSSRPGIPSSSSVVTPSSTPTPTPSASSRRTSPSVPSVSMASSSAVSSPSSRPITPSSRSIRVSTPLLSGTPKPSSRRIIPISRSVRSSSPSVSSTARPSSPAVSSPSSRLVIPTSRSIRPSTPSLSRTVIPSSPTRQPTPPASRSSSVPVIPASSRTPFIPSSVASVSPSNAITFSHTSPAQRSTSPASRSTSMPVILGSSTILFNPSSSSRVVSASPSTAVTSPHISSVLQSTSPISRSTSIQIIPGSSSISIIDPATGSVLPLSTVTSTTCTSTVKSSSDSSLPTASSDSLASASAAASNSAIAMTTSTIYTTRTSTVTACPSTVTNCPARSRTTYVTTETIYVSTTVCPVAGSESGAQATATTTEMLTSPSGHSEPVEKYTTSTVFSTRTATITACPSSVKNCPASAKTTFLTTETVFISKTICPVTELPSATGTAAPETLSFPEGHPEVSVSPIFSTRTATLTSCPSGVVGCPATEVVTQVATETLLVGESTYTLPATASAGPVQTLSPASSQQSPAFGAVGNAVPTSAKYPFSTGIPSNKSAVFISSAPLPSTTSTAQATPPAFNGVESLSQRASWSHFLVSFAVGGLVLFCL